MLEEKPPIEDFLAHYGRGHEDGGHSGRFPWGSGKDPYQHSEDFLSRIEELTKANMAYVDEDGTFGPKGKTYYGEAAVAHAMGLSTTQLRVQESLAKSEQKTKLYNRAKMLQDSGMGYTEIGRKLDMPESSVRSLLNPVSQNRRDKAQNTADFLRQMIDEKGMIEVGEGTERYLGISKEKLKEAMYILELEGYFHKSGRIPNVTDPSGQHQTTITVLGPKDSPNNALYKYEDINFIDINDYNAFREQTGLESLDNYKSEDNGETFKKRVFEYPASMDPSRLMVRYGDEGGKEKDGVIELRRGVDDLSLGDSSYSQVRILVNGTHYLKGMAIYSDDLPDGIDVLFNTNKPSGTPVMGDKDNSVLKPIKKDPDNPFGSNIRETGGQYHYIDKNGEDHLGLINKTRIEGDWSDWQDKLPSQFLSKQPKKLVDQQLNLALDEKIKEYNDISNLTNNTVKKYFLEEFASDCDSAAVHLYAAALPRQKHQVILPLTTMKDTEVYAPNYDNGEKVALIRYPHAGTFEIPILTVNNNDPDGKRIFGPNLKDAVAINSRVAERLSGADFDGDTVMVIPISSRSNIKSTPRLKELIDFDPKTEYGYSKVTKDAEGESHYYNKYGKEYSIMKNTDTEMGKISNLITDMTIAGANDDELARAVKHSMVVIDAEKHKLDYKSSYQINGIAELKELYQEGGASTIISRAKSELKVDKREGSPRVNIKGTEGYDPNRPEGSLIYKTASDKKLYYTQVKNPETGHWVDAYERNGKLVYNKTEDNGNKQFIDVLPTDKVKVLKRTSDSTKMAETDDATSLISRFNSPIEQSYARYANALKSLANEARKQAYMTKDILRDPKAAKEYAEEVQALKTKLDISEKNAPRERQAQILATSRSRAKIQDNPGMTKGEQKKLRDRELKEARRQVGASRREIDISDREWQAIQSGAISKTDLKKIMNHSNKDRLYQLATPRTSRTVTSAMEQRIRMMKNAGRTNSEIARALGLSATTVSEYATPQ